MLSKTHDYTKPRLGHDCTFNPIDGGLRGRMMGWGNGLAIGDFIILTNGNGTTRYQINKISYFPDPSDMWSADVSFAPREAVKDDN